MRMNERSMHKTDAALIKLTPAEFTVQMSSLRETVREMHRQVGGLRLAE